MTLQLKPLQSRFGRRLLLLFVGCAIVPIAVVAAVSYRHVTRHLVAQSETRLHQANKALGLAIFERLLLLDATLKSIPARAILQLEAARHEPERPAAPPLPQPAPAPRVVLRGPVHRGPDPVRSPGRPAGLGGVVAGSRSRPQRSIADQAGPVPATTEEQREASRTLVAGLDLLARRRFVALEFVADDGARTPVFGRLERLPDRSPRLTARTSPPACRW